MTRKHIDIQLKEVRKPAGYGTLVAVLSVDEDTRELWFQHEENPDIVRIVTLNLADGKNSSVLVNARGRRER